MPRSRSRKSLGCVIIPAYNEEASISQVIRDVRRHQPSLDIVVIDDGSTDLTAQRVKAEGVALITHTRNQGIGGAVQSGLRYAAVGKYDFAVQIDADGQHDPSSLHQLLDSLGDADLVIGSRFIEETSYPGTFFRWIGNRVLSLCIWMSTGRWVHDSKSGYRVFRQSVFPLLTASYWRDFPEPESIVLLLKQKFRIKEVSVEMRKRQAGRSSIVMLQSMYLMLAIPLRIFRLSFNL